MKEREEIAKQIPIPKRPDGRIDWRKLNANPGDLENFIEQEVGKFIVQGNVLTFKGLLKAGMGSISHGIQRYYPRGLFGLQEHFGLAKRKNPERVKGLSKSKAKKIILEDARRIVAEEEVLSAARHGYLYSRARQHYPGGWPQLKKDVGFKPRITREFSLEETRREALDFFKKEGNISMSLLQEKGKAALVARINRRYPGGIRQLKKDIGFIEKRRPRKFWKSEENIEREAREFFEKYGGLTPSLLIANNRTDLWAAVGRYYSGRWPKLRERLGITEIVSSEKANDYAEGLVK